jgi:hypothetical protein
MWDTGGMIDMEQPNYLEKNMSQCHFVHTKNPTKTAPGMHIASALQGQQLTILAMAWPMLIIQKETIFHWIYIYKDMGYVNLSENKYITVPLNFGIYC